MKVKGIIVGGISASLEEAAPTLPFPVVATEGYGNLPMSLEVFDILKRLEGHEASVSGRMGEVWDDTRPAIIIPLAGHPEETKISTDTLPAESVQVGDRVRAVRYPLLGQVGEIVSMVAQPRSLASGLSQPGVLVVFADSDPTSSQRETISRGDSDNEYQSGTSKFVPWLNLERIG